MNRKFGEKANEFGLVQGDVPSRYIKALPKNAKKRKDNIVALGEATGHHHIIEIVEGNAELYDDELGNLFMKVNSPVRILHQEHGYGEYTQKGIVQFGLNGVHQIEYAGDEERIARD